jgi:hypothetical protein
METSLADAAPQVSRVAWNALAAARIAHVERQFEAFKAAYEAPIAKRFVEVVAPRVEKERETVRLERRVASRSFRISRHNEKVVNPFLARDKEIDQLLRAHAASEPTPEQETLAGLPLPGVTVGELAAVHEEGLSKSEQEARLLDELRSVGIATLKDESDDDASTANSTAAAAADEALEHQGVVLITHDRRYETAYADTPFQASEALLRQRRVVLVVDVDSLQLPMLAEQRLIDLVGVRYDPARHRIKIAADAFEQRSTNTYAVLRIFKQLINEAFLADSNYVPPPRGSQPTPFEAAAAEEAEWFAKLRATGAEFTSPLQVGPGLAPIAFMDRVQRDVEHDRRVASGAALADEQPRLRLFHFEAVPTAAERAEADKQMRELVQALSKSEQQ